MRQSLGTWGEDTSLAGSSASPVEFGTPLENRAAMLHNDANAPAHQGLAMTAVETAAPFASSETSVKTRYLVVDTESVPDGELIAQTKYPDGALTPAAAIAKAQDEARESSHTNSDFLPRFASSKSEWITHCKRSNAWMHRTIGRRRLCVNSGVAWKIRTSRPIW